MRRDKLFIYEVNTWVWLTELSQRYDRPVTLDTVPDEALGELLEPNIDAVWLMGVWKRSEFARRNALKYTHEYVGALPDLAAEDVIGSAYSIADYSVDERIGGRTGLAAFRARLHARGIRLILDYVPNHVAVDHPWVTQKSGFIVQGTERDLRRRPSDFFTATGPDGEARVLAHGRDPYFPGWSDTAQLNAFRMRLRRAVRETLLDIAAQCDGVRCDMAMLVTNDVFATTWRGRVDHRPAQEFWPPLISAVRAVWPEFLFIAEVYWGKEWDMLQQGFDYTYDKTLYDRVMEGDIQKLRSHLVADLGFQRRLVRFVENHDEPRAYERLGRGRSFPAATLITTLPGACLLHQGQLEGRTVKLPVQIRRAPEERARPELRTAYVKLLYETRHTVYETGDWYLFILRPAGPGDTTYLNLLAYGWRLKGEEYRLVVVNLTPSAAYARCPLNFWGELAGRQWVLRDVMDNRTYLRDGDEMMAPGLFVGLNAYESHVFRFERYG